LVEIEGDFVSEEGSPVDGRMRMKRESLARESSLYPIEQSQRDFELSVWGVSPLCANKTTVTME
jgi:hypothetical protein